MRLQAGSPYPELLQWQLKSLAILTCKQEQVEEQESPSLPFNTFDFQAL